MTAPSETGGGLALVLGLLPPLAGAAVLGTLINAIGVKWHGGFFAPTGIEFELILATAVALCLAGAGGFPQERAIPVLRQHRPAYSMAAALFGAGTAAVFLLFCI